VAQGGVQEISLHPELRAIVGADAVGAVVTGSIAAADPVTQLAAVRVGHGLINVSLRDVTPGARVRVQVLARDVILATQKTEGLSVRNKLRGTIVQIVGDVEQTDLVHVDVGGATILARVTRAASLALSLRPGLAVWALVKAVSIRGHAFRAPR
jgi:molybdate transport system ATP-binding protein